MRPFEMHPKESRFLEKAAKLFAILTEDPETAEILFATSKPTVILVANIFATDKPTVNLAEILFATEKPTVNLAEILFATSKTTLESVANRFATIHEILNTVKNFFESIYKRCTRKDENTPFAGNHPPARPAFRRKQTAQRRTNL